MKPYQTIEYALLILSVPCNFFLVKQKRNSGKLEGCRIFVEKEQECGIRTLLPPPFQIPDQMEPSSHRALWLIFLIA